MYSDKKILDVVKMLRLLEVAMTKTISQMENIKAFGQ